jgi:signal transduction histidine kinase
MKERVERIGGKFVLRSQAGAGTELMIQVPRKAIDAQEPVTGMVL